MRKNIRRPGAWPVFALSTITLAVSSSLYAAEGEGDTNKDQEEAESVVVVGSRAAPRSVTESSVPVDVISSKELDRSGASNMSDLIANAVPSFNVNTQPISDAATLVRPANLRGLPPDNTLILVNGKRRHRSSVITFLGGGLSDGSHGPDLGVIPTNALKQVEVLRDGAAAQYGSDAIAGVLNFVLKDDNNGGSAGVRWGQYYEGDGDSLRISANAGFAPTDNSFINVSLEMKNSDATDRSVQRNDAKALIEAGYPVKDPAQVWGSPEVKDDYTLFFNSGLDLGASSHLYAFGNVSSREIEGGFFFRDPTKRHGVFTVDEGETLLIADRTGAGGCGSIDLRRQLDADPELDLRQFGDVMAEVNALPSNCFTFLSQFPGGFTPRFGGTVEDSSIVFGTSGEFAGAWTYDFSYTRGQNKSEFVIMNTVNAAYNAAVGPGAQTEFSPGGYEQIEQYLNADFSKEFRGLTIATGLEFRRESFETMQGEYASWATPVPIIEQGFGVGSNGFPGFAPRMAGKWSRNNWAAYLDMEKDIADEATIGLALRTEDYQDFGSTFDYKLSALIHLDDAWAVRASMSTGFRAPTVGQTNVVNVTTQFVAGQGLVDQATLPASDPIAELKGAEALAPEESNSQTIGLVGELGDFYVTIDWYEIEVYNRIAQSSAKTLTPQDIADLIARGITDAASFSSVTFFTNDFDTTTKGMDIVINYSTEWFGAPTKLAWLTNYTETTVDEFDSEIISSTRLRQLEENLPKVRSSFSATQDYGDLSALFRVNYYGKYFEAHLDDEAFPINAGAEFTVDVEFQYDVTDAMQLKFGVQNLFDEYPDETPVIQTADGPLDLGADVAGARYPTTSPMGFNGGFYYLEANYAW